MKGAAGIPIVVAAAALIVLGLAWGAASQNETFQGQQGDEQLEAAGNLVPLTALVVAIGCFLACMAIGQAPVLQRLRASAQAAIACWILVFLLQGDFPNFDTVEGSGQANLGQGTLLASGSGAPTVLLPVMVAGLVLLWGVLDGVRRALGHDAAGSNPLALHRRMLATSALAIPFLVMVIVGAVQVMLDIPATQDAAGLAYVLLPVAALAAGAWIVLLLLRAWHARGVLAEPRLAPFTRESWDLFARIEWAVVGVTIAAAGLSTALPAMESGSTDVGRTLVFTLRSHGQGLAFAAVALIPSIRAARRFRTMLDDEWTEPRDTLRETVGFTIALGVAILAGLLAGLTGLALLPWMVSLLPAAIFAGIHAPSRHALPVLALAAWAFWARGNAIAAFYDEAQYPTLEFATQPGLLALWRLVGVALLGWAIYRALANARQGERRSIGITMALLAAIGIPLVVLLELPLWLWDEGRVPVNKLAVGSLLRSQPFGVQVVSHIVASLAGLGAALATARLLRPDWFLRRPKPITAPSTAANAAATR